VAEVIFFFAYALEVGTHEPPNGLPRVPDVRLLGQHERRGIERQALRC
jgi:hypothetical protein